MDIRIIFAATESDEITRVISFGSFEPPLDKAVEEAEKSDGQKKFNFMLGECSGICGV